MTSYIGADDADGSNIVWEKTGAKNSLYGEDLNVVGFLGKTHNDKYNRQYWTSDNFTVGIEWLKVNITVGTGANKAVGSRRIRVIPTSNLTPGKDKTDLTVGDKMNHALDVYMAYSTGGRLSTDWKDVTTGVYPDLPYPTSPSDPRIPIQGQSAPTEFTAGNDQFNDVKTTYMIPGNGGSQGHKHPNNVLKTALYKVIKVDDTGRIIFDDKNKIELTEDNSWGKKLNGKEALASEDTGRYVMEYTWIMPDGRYLRDSKMLTIRDKQHNVSVHVQNPDKTKNSTSLELAVDQYDYKQPKPSPDFKGSVSSFDKEIDRYKPALISAKKINVDSLITEISMKITTIDGVQSKTFSNVQIGEKVTMPVKYYYGSHEDAGNYYVRTVTVNKEYTLDYDKSGGFYFIALENEWTDPDSTLEYKDVDFDIELLITVKENLGSLHVTKNTYVDGKIGFTNDAFPIEITNDKGYISTLLLESIKDKNDALIKLNTGTYTLKELLPMNYEYQSIIIDGKTITDPEVEFEIKKDQTVKIIINNKKISKLGGSSSVENKLDKFR